MQLMRLHVASILISIFCIFPTDLYAVFHSAIHPIIWILSAVGSILMYNLPIF